MTPLTADLFARAIIASAVSMGELQSTRQRCADITVSSYLPASVAVAMEAKLPLTAVCRILGVTADAVAFARRADLERFRRAQDAAREAVRYHLKVEAERQPVEAPAEPVSAPVEAVEPPAAVVVAAPVVPAPAAPPARSRAKSRPACQEPAPRRATRAIPRSARIENLGNGVSVIRLKPITDSILRHAQQQAAKGAAVDDLAELFSVDPEALRKRLHLVGSDAQ